VTQHVHKAQEARAVTDNMQYLKIAGYHNDMENVFRAVTDNNTLCHTT
jgi:hypothetical protein